MSLIHLVFILPYPKAELEILAGYPLLEPTFSVPDNMAPLVFYSGKLADIRQSFAQIPELM